MSKRTPRLLLEDIVEAVEKIIRYTREMSYEDFIADARTFDAVVRDFEIIGEAASRQPEAFEEQHPSIEWHRVVGMRNRLIHGYFGVDPSIVWRVVKQELDPLRTACTHILNTYKEIP